VKATSSPSRSGAPRGDRVALATRAALRAWLARHHATHPGMWLVSWKPATGKPRVKYAEAVEEALCVGWIDGGLRTLDGERSMLWLTRRRPRSRWSALNKSRVALLEKAGLMRAAGRAAIAAAKRDGSWSSLDAVEAMVLPEDLRRALDANAVAARHFAAFPKSVRKPLLAWIGDAKRATTRAARIAVLVQRVAANERPPYRMA
jgi:uncharacterized protein YdeI (YjbR/CyaY-like superfamily)